MYWLFSGLYFKNKHFNFPFGNSGGRQNIISCYGCQVSRISKTMLLATDAIS